MFENIRKCLDDYEIALEKNYWESDSIEFFTMNFAKAIMKDLFFDNHDESVAKIIMATKGLSNEINVKVK